MKKRVTGLLLALCLCLTLLPGTAGAAETANKTADFTATDNGAAAIALLNQHKTDGAADSTWDSGTKTLTLRGIDFTTTAPTAVKLPGGSTIVLADGSTNTIRSGDATASVDGEHRNPIFITALDALGNLTIQGGTKGTGTLSVTSGSYKNAGNGWTHTSGITVYGDFTVKGGHVTATGGLAEANGLCMSIGVNMDNGIKNKALLVTGGTLTAIAGEAYTMKDGVRDSAEFSRGVYLYRGNVSVSGDGRLMARSVPEMADAGLLSDGLYISVGDLLVAGAGEVSVSGAYGVNISGGGIRLDNGKLTAVSTQTADIYGNAGNAIYVDWEGGISSVNTENSANITVNGGTLETENGKIYVADYGAPDTNGLFTVTGGTVVNRGRLEGAAKVNISGGSVQTQGIDANALTLSGGSLTVREPVRTSPYDSTLLLVNPAVEVSTLAVSGGTLDAAWNWGKITPSVLPVNDYYGYATSLVQMPRDFHTATFNGGTTILDTGCAGNTALLIKGQLTTGSGVAETGANTDSTGAHKQEYADTPVVFSDVTRAPVTVGGVTAQNKTYDGTTAATLTAGNLTGVRTGDTVFLGSANVTANFDNASVGEDKTVTVAEGGTFDLRGKDAYKYELKTQPTDLTGLKATIAAYTKIKDVTDKNQTIYVGESGFAAPKFTGVTVNGVTETVIGDVTYKVGNDTMTVEQIGTALKTLKAGEKLKIDYSFTASGNYSGEKTGTITVTAQDRPAPGTSGSVRYEVAVAKADHGAVSASAARAAAGDTVTLTVQPDSGYVLAALTVTDSQGREIKLTRLDGGKSTFTMPGSRVEVKAAFAGITFSDVPSGAYYAEAVRWAVEKGVTNGTGDGTFQPNGSCTRAQLAAFLWRLAGEPESTRDLTFTDVRADAWCAKALRWAAEQGIVTGYADGSFHPDQTVTRIQAVAMLYRYAKAQGMDTTRGGMAVREFDDFAAVPAYALEAAGWAVNAGILRGAGNRLMPNDPCTRAQIVTFLYRAMQGK